MCHCERKKEKCSVRYNQLTGTSLTPTPASVRACVCVSLCVVSFSALTKPEHQTQRENELKEVTSSACGFESERVL